MTITIRVTPNGVEVDNRRFLLAEQALIGLAPEVALKRVDVLLALCGHAHQAALKLALVAAQGGDHVLATQQILPTLIHSSLQEHARYLAMSARVLPVTLARQLLQASVQEAPKMWKELVFGQSWSDCYAALTINSQKQSKQQNQQRQQNEQRSIAGLYDWLNTKQATSQASSVIAWNFDKWLRSARELSDEVFAIDAPRAIAAPCATDSPAAVPEVSSLRLPTTATQWQEWQALTQVPSVQRYRPLYQGQCADASVAALYGATGHMVARELARLAQIVRMISGADGVDADTSAFRLAPQDGMAAVEMARGILVHRVRLDAMGKIAEVNILAPTEWMFHPQGVVQQTLESMRQRGVLNVDRINAVMQIFDPCVAWQVE